MLNLIISNLLNNRKKFILLLVGTLVISIGLSSLTGLLNTNKGTVVNILKQNWKSQYHIVVRPRGTKSISEKDGLLDPNYLSNLRGGISMAQYKEIKSMKDISIAAPIANLGYLDFVYSTGKIDSSKLKPNAIYKLNTTSTTTNGFETYTIKRTNYYSPNYPQFVDSSFNLYYIGRLSLAAIDPVEEAKLTGLDKATERGNYYHYFSSKDKFYKDKDSGSFRFPVLLTSHVINNSIFNTQSSLSIVNLPYKNPKQMNSFISKNTDIHNPQKTLSALNKRDTKLVKTLNIPSKTSDQVYQGFLKDVFRDNNFELNRTVTLFPALYSVGVLNYQKVESPFPKRWQHAYKLVENEQISKSDNEIENYSFSSYRSIKQTSDNLWGYPIGVFDPTKLTISKDPLSQIPMTTYRSPTAKLMLDANANPVNPPKNVYPTINPADFLVNPPMALTTIDAATKILGDKPISAIRIKVKGVDSYSKESEAKLKNVAKEIENKTGLLATVTLGSSPQSTLVYVPKTQNTKPLGWIELPYINLGASITLFNNTQVSFDWVMLIVLCVAIVYVFATQWIRFLTRRREFAVQLSLGWSPNLLSRIILLEGLLLGIFSFIVSVIVNLGFKFTHPGTIGWVPVFTVGGLAIVIYLAGSLIPAMLVRNLKPYQTIRFGDIPSKPHRMSQSLGLLGMAFNHMVNKLYRYLLSVFSMLLPTVLLAFFIFVTIRLKGVFYTSWLGQYASMQVGKGQIIAMVVTLIIATLTTVEIMIQNVHEREPELALLKSIGWRNRTIRALILLEGLWIGFITSILSLIASFILMRAIQQPLTSLNLFVLIGASLIPMMVGTVSGLIPAEIAIRLAPYQRLKSE